MIPTTYINIRSDLIKLSQLRTKSHIMQTEHYFEELFFILQ